MKNSSLHSLCAAVLVATLFVPATGAAQSILKTAGEFALLGSSDISNDGATTISNGNVGVTDANEAIITGFPPGLIINGEKTVTLDNQQAKEDRGIALTGLTNFVALENTTITSGALGGLILTPGAYSLPAAGSQTGVLTLDGNNQKDAYWVFHMTGAFTTAADATVEVINAVEGSHYGIFWIAEAITFGATTLGIVFLRRFYIKRRA